MSGVRHRIFTETSRPCAGVTDARSLDVYPARGSAWEGLILEQLRSRGREPCYWRTHTGAAPDLFVPAPGQALGIEIKLTSRPVVTPSMRHAVTDLQLKEPVVAHAGAQSYPLTRKIRAAAARRLLTDL